VIPPAGRRHHAARRCNGLACRQRFRCATPNARVGPSRWRIRRVTYALRNAIMTRHPPSRGIVFSTMLRRPSPIAAWSKVYYWPWRRSLMRWNALCRSEYAPVRAFVLMMASVFEGGSTLARRYYSTGSPISGRSIRHERPRRFVTRLMRYCAATLCRHRRGRTCRPFDRFIAGLGRRCYLRSDARMCSQRRMIAPPSRAPHPTAPDQRGRDT